MGENLLLGRGAGSGSKRSQRDQLIGPAPKHCEGDDRGDGDTVE
jgi:hypothetical protein